MKLRFGGAVGGGCKTEEEEEETRQRRGGVIFSSTTTTHSLKFPSSQNIPLLLFSNVDELVVPLVNSSKQQSKQQRAVHDS